ncbi:MAG: GIY-YIG nuclease family protein [Bacteroidetes bacterium]|nr:GIY-YIG nuclease family protein [Bacteroidota bacterium]
MKFYVYILQSTTSCRFYIGQTQDLKSRIERHNRGYEKSTKNRGPWKLIYSTEFQTRSEAVILEHKLKNFKSRSRIIKWIESRGKDLNNIYEGRGSRKTKNL